MDYSNLQYLKKKQEEELERCNENIAKWQKFSSDYQDLEERLISLPDKVSYNIMVPLCGNVALVPGKMVHTNEIMVLLGEDYLVERSAKQAAAIAKRRLNYCEEMMKQIKEEKSNFENWWKYTSNVQEDEGIDIKEEYKEEEETAWRERHKQNVKKYKTSNLNDETSTQDGGNEISDSDIWARLNELEIKEQEISQESEEDIHSSQESDATNDSSTSDDEELNTRKEIRWKDIVDKKVETNYIYFKHSSSEVPKTKSNLKNSIDKPSEVYDRYLEETSNNKKLKSILKNPSKEDLSIPIINEDNVDSSPFCHQGNLCVNKPLKTTATQKCDSSLAFSGDIKERNPTVHDTKNKDSKENAGNLEKTVSRFKARRMKK